MDLERRLLEMYADPTLDTKPALLDRPRRRLVQRGRRAAARLAQRRRRRRPGRRRPQRRRDARPRSRRRRRGAGAHRSRRRPPDPPAADAAGDARPRARGEGLRAARHPRGAVRRARRRPAPRSRRIRWSVAAIGDVDPAARRAARGEPPVPRRRSARRDVIDAARSRRGCAARSARSRRPSSGSSPSADELEAVAAAIGRARPALDDDRRPRHLRPRRGVRPVPDRDAPRAPDRPRQAIGHDASTAPRLDWRGGLLLAISQSGRSPDIVAVVEAARRSGAPHAWRSRTTTARPLAAAAELRPAHATPGASWRCRPRRRTSPSWPWWPRSSPRMRPTPALAGGPRRAARRAARRRGGHRRLAGRAGATAVDAVRGRGPGARSCRAASTWPPRSSWR